MYGHAVEGKGTDHCTNTANDEYEYVQTDGGKEMCGDKAM